MWIIHFQAFENNEEMKHKARRDLSEEIQAPPVDKVCG
jgi:5'-3' exoribonuclease 2